MKRRLRALGVIAGVLSQLGPSPAALAQDAAGEDRVVSGTIIGTFQGRRTRLSFALVEATTGTARIRTTADAEGRYTLAGLPAGEATLRVTLTGYEPLTLVVVVPSRGALRVDLELRADPLVLPPIDVASDASSPRPEPGAAQDAELPEIAMRALDLGPGLGQAGMLDVIGSLPGNDPADPTDVLYMRGSTTDMKLVLLDGVPVYTPFHVAGLLRSFEPAVLDAADLYMGGAPARFDGGLTHILDLRTRRARKDRARFSGSVDLLSASAAAELPLGGRVGVIASGRSLHDLGSGPLGGARPYGYRDGLVRADAELAAGHRLEATGFWNEESVLLDPARSLDDARWSNRAGSGRYSAELGGARIDVSGGLSAYRADLPLQPGRLPGQPLPPSLLARAVTDRARVVGEVTWGPAAAPLRSGVSVERVDAGFEARTTGGGPTVASRGSSTALGAFLDATRRLAPGLTARVGVRVDHFRGLSTKLAPRGAVMIDVGPQALLTIAAGRYHQPTRTPEVEVERTLAEVALQGVPAGDLLPVATADHVVLTLDQRLGSRVRLGLEGFWKGFSNLPTTGGETVRNSGVDLRLGAAGEEATAWLGYGLSWFWSTTDLSGFTSDFAGRHLLSAGLAGPLGGPLAGEVRVAYGAGLPYTSVPFGQAAGEAASPSAGPSPTSRADVTGPLVDGLDGAFLRVDVEVYATLQPRVGSRTWRVRPYVRLLNALDRRDALFYAFQPWRSDRVTPLAERPLLPLVGVAIAF